VVLVQVAEDLFMAFMVSKAFKDLCYAPPVFKDLCRLPLRTYAMRRRRLLHRRSVSGAVLKVVKDPFKVIKVLKDLATVPQCQWSCLRSFRTCLAAYGG
jgi:hypothetical protein